MRKSSNNSRRQQPIPLSQEQLSKCRDAAFKGPYGAKFVFDVIPYTGLKKNEFLHLREDWILWGDGDALNNDRPIVIDIPPEAECRHITWKNSRAETEPKPGLCSNCEKKGRSRWKSYGEVSVRQVPVAQPCAKKELRRWFRQLNYNAVPWCGSSLNYLIDRTATNTNLNREVKPMDLTVTFVLVAAERGDFTRDEIAEMSGRYKKQGTFNNILRQSSADFGFSLTVPEVLAYINECQPISITKMSKQLDIAMNTAYEWVHQLEEEGLIKESQADHDLHPDNIIYELSSGVEPNDKLHCPIETCDRRFFNFGTRTQHVEQIHNGKEY